MTPVDDHARFLEEFPLIYGSRVGIVRGVVVVMAVEGRLVGDEEIAAAGPGLAEGAGRAHPGDGDGFYRTVRVAGLERVAGLGLVHPGAERAEVFFDVAGRKTPGRRLLGAEKGQKPLERSRPE